MNFIKIKLFYLFLISFSCIYAMDMDIDGNKSHYNAKPFVSLKKADNLLSEKEKINEYAKLNFGLENALKNADLDWFETILPSFIDKYPKILNNKFYFGDYKVDIRATIIAQAKWAKLNEQDDKYQKYISIYNLLTNLYSSNLPVIDEISISVIRNELSYDLDLLNLLGLSRNFLQSYLKRPISEVSGKIAEQESKRFKSE